MKSLLAATLLAAISGSLHAQVVSQAQLNSGGTIPGNLLIVPSVEWPTIDSQANISKNYSSAEEYSGYFDPAKCYVYNPDATVEANRYFYPTRFTSVDGNGFSTHKCGGANEWSGNFMNWAATQTIDPFRKALTGGLRTTDTPSLTLLEKARSDSNTSAGIYGDRNLDTVELANATPAGAWAGIGTRLRNLGNKMYFGNVGVDLGGTPDRLYSNQDLSRPNNLVRLFEVSVRVAVCYSDTLLEDNCVKYSGGYKPEGLIQKYSYRMRYSAWGYLNDHDTNRDGAALRAQQKFVGSQYLDPTSGKVVATDAPEWDSKTGILYQNPDAADATATSGAVGKTIADSGVINYINKFGQMTGKNHKSLDPVSEMYYAALRYLRNKGNVPEYTNLTGSADNRYELADGFPVITNWNDPFEFKTSDGSKILLACQKSAILGIGDVNTWNDKNLKGSTSNASEPAMPGTVASDTIDVNEWTQKVATIEGITINTEFTGRNNSAYMVGLAYWAHTQDIRTDAKMEGKQTVATYWVDVREAQVLQGKATNQYWLAAKYGGFTVPDDYNSMTAATALDPKLWYTNGDDLDPGAGVYQRADNFYVASQADAMIDSLTRAFARIANDRIGSGASLAANSTRIDTTTRTFQAQFTANSYGLIQAFDIDDKTGIIKSTPDWTTGNPLAGDGVALNGPDWKTGTPWKDRQIFMNSAGSKAEFKGANITTTQQTGFKFAGFPKTTSVKKVSMDEMVNYMRGDQSREEDRDNKGALRVRIEPKSGWGIALGDVVNSTPIFVGAPNAALYQSSTFSGAAQYAAFATANKNRIGVLYVGGNDGMLHAINATTGRELWAFVPNASFERGLGEYANPDYEHRYFVDGDMAIADAYDGSSWRTILVGTMGRGGPGIFALDITNPLDAKVTSASTGVRFLWEHSTDITGLGKNIGRPVIAQTANGVWKVFVGNGLDGDNSATLVAIELFNGTSVVTKQAKSPSGSNGLSALLIRDTDLDGFADAAYGGDLQGNVYKFTNVGNSSPGVSTLYAAGVKKPVTAAPLVGKDPATSITWVFFGTGEYLNSGDLQNKDTQTWYGIQDNAGATVASSDLKERKVVSTSSFDEDGDLVNTKDDIITLRVMDEATSGDMAGKKGWFFDLPGSNTAGVKERMVVPNRFQGGAIIGTTRIPDALNACKPTGTGFIMALNPFTGGRLDQTFFDTNRDGKFDDADKSGGSIASGMSMLSSPNAPIFIENVMQVSLDDGTTRSIRTQGSNVDTSRLSWREVINN